MRRMPLALQQTLTHLTSSVSRSTLFTFGRHTQYQVGVLLLHLATDHNCTAAGLNLALAYHGVTAPAGPESKVAAALQLTRQLWHCPVAALPGPTSFELRQVVAVAVHRWAAACMLARSKTTCSCCMRLDDSNTPPIARCALGSCTALPDCCDAACLIAGIMMQA